MANVDIRVGKKDSTFFSANPTLILKDGQLIYNETTGDLFIGDGVTQLSSLVAINGGGNQDLQNVTDLGANTTNQIQINSVNVATVNDIVQVNTSTIGSAINGATSATPNDTDLVMSVESSVAKKNTWTQIKAFLKTYFDTVYTTTSAVATQITTALSGYATQSWVTSQGYITNVITALGFTPEDVANKSNSYTVSSSTTYATTKAIVDGLATKQDTLVSSTNIKTVGGVNVLGSGDVATPTFTNPIVGTQTQGDNSTKAASTSYVDTAIGSITVRRIHNYQNTDSTTTGSTNETVLANLKVTGGAMGNNGVLSVESFQCKSGSAGSLSWKYYVSTVSTNTVGNTGVPTSSTQIGAGTQTATTLTGGRYLRKMANKNSASTQFVIPTAVTANSDYSSTSIARNAININTANDFWVVVTATLANSADTAILSDIQLNIDKP